MSGVAAYRGHFGSVQAERLLWRAGFGPRKNEAAELAKLGLEGAVHSLVYPGREHFVGPPPHDEKGHPLAPYDAWGHDHLWWLDRMVRTSRPLVERMTLVWHDWFATSNQGVGSQRLMIDQNNLFRERGLGYFHDLLLDVTKDPAMLRLAERQRQLEVLAERELRPRDDGALHARRRPRLHRDRRAPERARAHRLPQRLEARTSASRTSASTRSTTTPARRRSSRRRGTYTWKDSCRLCVTHPDHPSFFVQKLWSYFVPTAPDAATQSGLQQLYVTEQVRGAAGRRGDPPPSGALRGAADGEVARPLHGGAPAPARPPDRHLRLDVARRDGGPAALLPAERRRLGRHALARHGAVARPLVDRAVRAQPVRARSRQGEAAVRRAEARPRRRSASGASRRSARGRSPRSRRSRRTRSPTRRARSGSSSSTRRWSQNALRHLIAVSPEFQAA